MGRAKPSRDSKVAMEVVVLHLCAPAQKRVHALSVLPFDCAQGKIGPHRHRRRSEVAPFDFGAPAEKRGNAAPILPEEAEEVLAGEAVGLDPEESLHPPAQVGTPPGPQPVALRHPPEVAQRVDQARILPIRCKGLGPPSGCRLDYAPGKRVCHSEEPRLPQGDPSAALPSARSAGSGQTGQARNLSRGGIHS